MTFALRPRLVSLLTLAALAGAAPLSAQEMRDITASLIYLPRIALPAEAEITLRVTDAEGTEVLRDALPTGGKQVPLDVVFGAPTGAVTLEAGVQLAGDPIWRAAPVAIPAGTEAVALGPIEMHPVPPTHAWTCGGEVLRLRFAGEKAELDTGGDVIALRQTVTASGARYEAEDDPGTWVWNKGEDLTASLDGQELPPCTPGATEAAAAPTLTARGNEPGWRVDLGPDSARLRTQDGRDETLAVTGPETGPEGRLYSFDGGTLKITDGLCHDSMTGLPYPAQATLTQGGTAMTGCAGDPMALLEGAEWVVEDLGGAGIIDSSHVTLQFQDGRAAGSAGCNRWFAEVRLSGEGLSFGPAGSTMMACPDALMAQERRFLDALEKVDGVDIDGTGALRLTAGGEPVLTARR